MVKYVMHGGMKSKMKNSPVFLSLLFLQLGEGSRGLAVCLWDGGRRIGEQGQQFDCKLVVREPVKTQQLTNSHLLTVSMTAAVLGCICESVAELWP